MNKLIATFHTGSRAYGTALPESDFDVIRIEYSPLNTLLGFSKVKPKQTFSGKDDITILTLNHFLQQCMKGAPNSLELLWLTPQVSTATWDTIITDREVFLHKGMINAWLGMAKNNDVKATSILGNLHQSLLTKKARAWKHRMHSIRVLQECAELLSTGELVFPRYNSEDLLALRNGAVDNRSYLEMYADAREKVTELESSISWLPDVPRREMVESILMELNAEWCLSNSVGE